MCEFGKNPSAIVSEKKLSPNSLKIEGNSRSSHPKYPPNSRYTISISLVYNRCKFEKNLLAIQERWKGTV